MVVNMEVHIHYLTTENVPAIHTQFIKRSPVILQHDNYKHHIQPSTMGIAFSGIHSIQLNYQPLNSPDFTFWTLEFFHSIERIQHKIVTGSIDELI